MVADHEISLDVTVPVPEPPRSIQRDLMLAIFEDAVRCYQATSTCAIRCPRDRRTEQRIAAVWLFANDFDAPFSFVNICETLGLDPTAARDAIVGSARQAA